MANPGLISKAARMLAKTPAGKKAKKKVLDTAGAIMEKGKKRFVKSKYKKGGKGPGATTRTTKPAEVSKSYGQQQASTNNLLKDGMTKKMEINKYKTIVK